MPLTPPSVSGLRYRSEAIVGKKLDLSHTVYYQNGKSTVLGTQRNIILDNKSRFIYDKVIPDFKRRSAMGEVFNNPMYRRESNQSRSVMRCTANIGGNQYICDTVPPWASEGNLSESSLTASNAITDAYANVTARASDGLLWLGEFKETIAMFMDICKLTQKLVKQTAYQRKQWAKGQLTVEGQQSLTLALLYGILPLEQSIAQFLEGIFLLKDVSKSERHTARGFRVSNSSENPKSKVRIQIPGFTAQDADSYISRRKTVEARAGVLFEIDMDSTSAPLIHLEPKAIVGTAYALARLSFVIDWIINVGGTLQAWSPSVGTNELAAWISVKKTTTIFQTVQLVASSQFEGSGSSELTVVETFRKPITRGDLPVIPRLDLNLDWEKVAAMVLLFAKVKREV